MIEQYLLEYGPMGLFVAYLIYDKQVVMKKVIKVLEKLVERIEKIESKTIL